LWAPTLKGERDPKGKTQQAKQQIQHCFMIKVLKKLGIEGIKE
jgi:hypothetical protein